MSKYKVGDCFVAKIKGITESFRGTEYLLEGDQCSGRIVSERFIDFLPRLTNGVNEYSHRIGMEDTFALMKRIANMDMKEFDEIFGGDMLFGDLFKFDTIKEIEERVKAHENRLKVGDVLKHKFSGECCVITRVGGNALYVLWPSGKATTVDKGSVCEKYERTTTQIPIKTLLAQMVRARQRMIKLKSPCRYCDRRYVGCHGKCYDYFMYRCWATWFNGQVKKVKDAANEYNACREAAHERLKHWDKKKRG